jgi:NitT/TauT family transport system substrate-binding protein
MAHIKRLLVVSTMALTLAVGCANPAAAAKITLMVGGIEKLVYLPAKLAETLGYFKDEGLTVELVSVKVAVEAAESLLAGEIQGVVGFYDHTIDLQAKGKAVECVVQLLQAPGDVELVDARKADKIKSAADFKDKNLGVSGLGS